MAEDEALFAAAALARLVGERALSIRTRDEKERCLHQLTRTRGRGVCTRSGVIMVRPGSCVHCQAGLPWCTSSSSSRSSFAGRSSSSPFTDTPRSTFGVCTRSWPDRAPTTGGGVSATVSGGGVADTGRLRSCTAPRFPRIGGDATPSNDMTMMCSIGAAKLWHGLYETFASGPWTAVPSEVHSGGAGTSLACSRDPLDIAPPRAHLRR